MRMECLVDTRPGRMWGVYHDGFRATRWFKQFLESVGERYPGRGSDWLVPSVSTEHPIYVHHAISLIIGFIDDRTAANIQIVKSGSRFLSNEAADYAESHSGTHA